MKKLCITATGLALSLAFALNLYAQITYDESTGTGFVSRDELQRVFGWKTADVKKNAGAVEFRHVALLQWAWDCQWVDGGIHTVSHESESGVYSWLVSEADQKGKAGAVTGFNLLGIDHIDISDPVLWPGECPDEDGHVTSLVPGSLQETFSSSLQVSNGGGFLALD